jgi:hypothetical protein
MIVKNPSALLPFLQDYLLHPEKIADDPPAATVALRTALAAPPYDTADNQQAATVLAIGAFEVGSTQKIGPIVQPSGIAISSLLWWLESGTEIPATIREKFPALQAVEWEAAVRLAVVVLSNLDITVSQPADE